ncbi:unnamed protein product [Coffea canephora]|uniref:SMP-30/Gluconolactonase/LRE-like region domain-containing protein n=1 Tax=Coffea canephora TaxID=49390 RepID=A0A068V931_COFCA|nr:unnamed protein product [Coffea canephora]
MARSPCCSTRCLLVLFLISAVPIGYVIRLETAGKAGRHVYEYQSVGWLRECSKWDDVNSRFIVSLFEGGMGVVPILAEHHHPKASALEEIQVVKDADLAGNATLGFTIDRPRNRVVVCIADILGNRYSALAAYDITTWNRLFLTKLSGPEDEKAFADDVAVDEEGNSYVTDPKGGKIWKVGATGQFLGTIRNPLFTPHGWQNQIVGINGIIYHPNGYFLVVHTMAGQLYKVATNAVAGKEAGPVVRLVKLVEGGSLKFGDGLELLSPTKLIVAGNPTRLVETTDDWDTARVSGVTKGATHRIVTAATVKDGRVYLNHILGLGYPKRKHILMEAVF